MVAPPPRGPHRPAPLPVHVEAADGAHLVVCEHGGQVLGWRPAGAEHDRLWLSPMACPAPHRTLLGGVPVVFPDAWYRTLPVAGDRPWRMTAGRAPTGAARMHAVLEEDPATLLRWPHRFRLDLEAEAHGSELRVTLTVTNPELPGGPELEFTAALPVHLAVETVLARVEGLADLPARDRVTGADRTPDGPVPCTGPLDLEVPSVPGPFRVHDVLSPGVEIEAGPAADGLTDVTLWNPGPGYPVDEVPEEDAAHFVRVAPARRSPVRLPPGARWTGRVVLTALVPRAPGR